MMLDSRRSRLLFPWVVFLGLSARPIPVARGEVPDPDPTRFEAEIAAFERQDRGQPPPVDSIVFLGSSSIRRWPLRESFPDLPVVNRGFGGSHFSDASYFVERILRGHHPRVVVLYEGDNDIQAGKSPQQVAEDCRQLTARIRELAPDARIVVISIKPSPARWQHFAAMQEANALMRAEVERSDRMAWVDVVPAMLDGTGKSCCRLFVDDCLHLSAEGYQLWTELIGCALRW